MYYIQSAERARDIELGLVQIQAVDSGSIPEGRWPLTEEMNDLSMLCELNLLTHSLTTRV
jgi:hypothetical protein